MRNSNVNERGNARRRIRLILNCYRTHVLTILSALLSHNIVMLLRRRSLNLPPLKYHKVKPLKTRHKAEFLSLETLSWFEREQHIEPTYWNYLSIWFLVSSGTFGATKNPERRYGLRGIKAAREKRTGRRSRRKRDKIGGAPLSALVLQKTRNIVLQCKQSQTHSTFPARLEAAPRRFGFGFAFATVVRVCPQANVFP